MTSKNKTLQKTTSFIVVIAIFIPTLFFLSIPQKTNAQWVVSDPANTAVNSITAANTGITAGTTSANTAISIKEVAKEVAKQILRMTVRRLLQEMTLSTINWINSGYHGAPLFLENPQSFFSDIAKYEVRTFIDEVGYNATLFPFGRDFALNTIYAYQRQAGENAQYTLSKVINDPVLLQGYRNDFRIGGWNGFLINTQYPQNNYIGFTLLASDELARRLDGTVVNNANRVTETLQQGLGFLSPETCLDNGGDNAYNQTIANQFKRPKFNESEHQRNNPYPDLGIYEGEGGVNNPVYIEEVRQWNADHDAEKAIWAANNTCRNLAATTPGSVVASQINNALLSPQRQGELDYAVGVSISSILDAMLNELIGNGLNALASKANQLPNLDYWNYNGLTLGGPGEGGINTAWNTGPEEVVILDEFKKNLQGRTIVVDEDGAVIREEIGNTGNGEYIQGDIANTREELALIYNLDTSNPGLFQVFTELWQSTKNLDMCVPGPDLHWQERLQEEKTKNDLQINQVSNNGDDEDNTLARANVVLRELQFAVNFFKDWVENKMLRELPSSIIFTDAIDELETLSQQSSELINLRRSRTQALARLESINSSLANFTTQPALRSNDEKTLVSLRKQYLATKLDISNSFTIEDRTNELTIAKEKFFRLEELIPRCNTERIENGWTKGGSNEWGWDSTLSGTTEKALFCDLPIVGGYPHEMFQRAINGNSNLPSSPEYQFLPLVNAEKVLTWDKWGWGTGDDSANINITCDIVFNANVLDYKGELPGFTPIGAQDQKPEWTTNPGGGSGNFSGNVGSTGGSCTGSGSYNGDVSSAITAAILADSTLANSLNTEENSFLFIAAVAAQIDSSPGLNGTDQVLNGNGNPTTGDLVAIWRNEDTTMERYDIIENAGAGDETIAEAAQVDYTGAIPLDCTNSGGGTNCSCGTSTGGTFASLESQVIAERGIYGSDIDKFQAGLILNAIAWHNRGNGWGLSGKTSGSFCPSPAGSIACDILHHQPTNTLVDVFGSAPDDELPIAPADPQWDVLGPPVTENRPWVAPVQP